jgi:hypothetical protein
MPGSRFSNSHSGKRIEGRSLEESDLAARAKGDAYVDRTVHDLEALIATHGGRRRSRASSSGDKILHREAAHVPKEGEFSLSGAAPGHSSGKGH